MTAARPRSYGSKTIETSLKTFENRWVGSWTAAPQLTEPENMPPPPFTGAGRVLADTTLRQTLRVSVGGRRVQLRFANTFGDTALPITAVSLACPAGGHTGASAIQPGTRRAVTFHGRRSVVVPAGAQVVSDPLDLDLPPRTALTVTVYLADGQGSTAVTSHPGSRTTSYLAPGDQTGAEDLAGATPVEHWYLLSGVDVWTASAGAAVLLGDSLTDGRGSTTDGNDRWPDQLLDRLRSTPGTAGIAILNQGAGGNRVLADGHGPSALARLDRDVLAQNGVRWLVLFEGVNDIGVAEATEAAQRAIAADLIAAYDQIILRAHARGLRIFGATLLAFGGHGDYDDPAGHRELARQIVNRWIRTSGRFDAVLDFDAVTRDPLVARWLRPEVDGGDHLHLNANGYRALADAVPTSLFR